MVWFSIDEDDNLKLFKRCASPQQNAAEYSDSLLTHTCALDLASNPSLIRFTSIICKIGRGCLDVETIERMIESGMNVACVSFAHGAHDLHAEKINNVRLATMNYSARVEGRCPVGVAVETKGPVIRTGLPLGGYGSQIFLKEGEIVTLTSDKEHQQRCTSSTLYIDYENLVGVMNVDQKIHINYEQITLRCLEITPDDEIKCVVERGGEMGSRCPVLLPGARVHLPTLTNKDKNDLIFALGQGVDMIFASAIKHSDQINEIREFLQTCEGGSVAVVAKIESLIALENLDGIIKASDGVLITRRTLGLELGYERLALAQKSIVARCNSIGKSVIVTTQLLESMIKAPRPTRAEAGDVANAVLDGADCIMLTNETSRGYYPTETIHTLSRLCKEAEAAFWMKNFFKDFFNKILAPVDLALTLALTAVDISFKIGASAIVVASNSNTTAHLVSKFRPKCLIITVTRNLTFARQAHLYRGVFPLVFKAKRSPKWAKDLDERVFFGINFGRKKRFIRSGDPVIILTASKQGNGYADNFRVLYVTRNVPHGNFCIC